MITGSTSPPSATQAKRYELVFLIISAIFLSTLVVINIIGLTRFVDLSIHFGEFTFPLLIPLGVLPYPITFLCTDLISEFYGKKKANLLVGVGLLVNIWILFIVWIGGLLPPEVLIDVNTQLPSKTHTDFAFFQMRLFTLGNVLGSMLAYIVAQFLDVHLFHFWKKMTQGKHLWLRNNASTLVSQFLDTCIVVFAAHFFAHAIPLDTQENIYIQLFSLILSIYTFKALMALLDTIPFYLLVFYLRRYFQLASEISPKSLLISSEISLSKSSLH